MVVYNCQQHSQLSGESLPNYVATLNKLSADSNFGVTTTVATPAVGAAAFGRDPTAPFRRVEASVSPRYTALPMDIMLRYRFVCGVNAGMLQQRLFAEHDLTFQKGFHVDVRAESAAKQPRNLKTGTKLSDVHEASQNHTVPDKLLRQTCFRFSNV